MPDEGGVWIRGSSLKDMESEERTIFRRRNIGFIFQQYNLIPMISVYENIVLPLRLDGAEIDQEFFEELTGTLGLKEKLGQLPETLSGGQQQRVAIARAVAAKPVIILADEPTGNLDTKSTLEIIDIFEQLNHDGKTVIMVTHEPELAAMTQRILTMRDGCLIQDERKG